SPPRRRPALPRGPPAPQRAAESAEEPVGLSAEPEIALADLQSLDPVLESRRGHLKLGRRAGWPRDSSSALGQGSLDDLLLAARGPGRRRRAGLGSRSRRLLGQPQLVHGEDLTRAQDDGPLDDVLQLTDVPWPVVGRKQLERLLVDRP